MKSKKLALTAMTFALCGTLGGGLALAGCTTAPATATDGDEAPMAQTGTEGAEAADDGIMTMQDWGKKYPLQYNSFKTCDYKLVQFSELDGMDTFYEDSDGITPQGHYAAMLTETGPISRDAESSLLFADDRFGVDSLDWDPDTKQWIVDDSTWVDVINEAGYTKGCYACRSSVFDREYKEKGAEVYAQPIDEEFAAQLKGQLWDCALCHDGEPGTNTDATATMFTQLARDTYDEFDPMERVCGQCHNTFNHRRWITDQETMDSFDPYKYGTDIDSLMKAELEDGIYDVDEDTGIKIGCFDEPELEQNQGGYHAELGLTCVDCHMPKVTDPESGETYTSHDASGSPLAKPESLEKCMSCHKGQGIDSTDDMIKMVREKQLQARKDLRAGKDRLANAYDLIKAAVDGKTVDEATLDQVREEYTYAEAELRIINSDSQGRAVHNPEKVADYIAKANSRIDTIEKTLGAA
ncbi:ammonia-forming cytochrome c nitrite reductase subunit c552 [uncultured Adlercreutzia sp.]|uniref:ammonia-forming cytochrome c nitrite reductase subunit c552 n=1 Tax=uncultured Adlercreutzia sp. TaxID=875803 RepID=UPI0026F3E893|nr:ammonia-forming cytochrome c nitrite reductase subunit c552 [uncultured Adlercreutzia sp.]